MTTQNALAAETSAYLRQHADNPVRWFPWGPEALDRAVAEDRPILLSIGYSACHWCHVMAHESFADPATAALMNAYFINIKVDREERPDLDRIYQVAHYLLTQRNGGWPLTLFLSPTDQIPFYGGTYFPPVSRYGLPAFQDVLQSIHTIYRDRRGDVLDQNETLASQLAALNTAGPAEIGPLGPLPLQEARHQTAHLFDPRHGGFGDGPKFPHTGEIDRLLRHAADRALAGAPDEEALNMALFSLSRMAERGLYDHLAGGFFRYCVDPQWTIPHFEKMLYDNALLLPLYAEAWQITGHAPFARVARETATWLMTTMRSPDGAFYASLGADSPAGEGHYYLWIPEEVAGLLNAEEYALFARRFGLLRAANFEGRWHLGMVEGGETQTLDGGPAATEMARQFDSARAKLAAARSRRPAPFCDEKVLTSWNALTIKALAETGTALGDHEMITAAWQALDFLQSQVFREGRLYATYQGGRARFPAYLDDYAFLLGATLACLSAEWRAGGLEFAVALAEGLLTHFEAPEGGGFFFVAHDHERLIQRSRSFADDATPAGNGVAASALCHLSHLVAEPRYLEAAFRTLRAGWHSLLAAPAAHAAMQNALDCLLSPPVLLLIRGAGTEARRWHRYATSAYAPRRLTFCIPWGAEGGSRPPGAVGLWDQMAAGPAAAPQETIAYLCSGTQCAPPIRSFAALMEALAASELPRR